MAVIFHALPARARGTVGVWSGVQSHVGRNIGDKAFLGGFEVSYLCLHSFLPPLQRTTHGVTKIMHLVSKVKVWENQIFQGCFVMGSRKSDPWKSKETLCCISVCYIGEVTVII